MTPTRVSFASVIATDMVDLAAYYSGLFGLREVETLRSQLFRGLLAGDVVLGFSHTDAAPLLELPPGKDGPGQQFLTFEVGSPEDVVEMTRRAVDEGGALIQAPHVTYYGAHQSVVADPEGNLFRINHLAVDEVDAGTGPGSSDPST